MCDVWCVTCDVWCVCRPYACVFVCLSITICVCLSSVCMWAVATGHQSKTSKKSKANRRNRRQIEQPSKLTTRSHVRNHNIFIEFVITGAFFSARSVPRHFWHAEIEQIERFDFLDFSSQSWVFQLKNLTLSCCTLRKANRHKEKNAAAEKIKCSKCSFLLSEHSNVKNRRVEHLNFFLGKSLPDTACESRFLPKCRV